MDNSIGELYELAVKLAKLTSCICILHKIITRFVAALIRECKSQFATIIYFCLGFDRLTTLIAYFIIFKITSPEILTEVNRCDKISEI